MRIFVANFKWIMLLSGLLTCTMFLGLVFPQNSLQSNFGETITGPVAEVIVRNWSALIGLIGLALIYGAFVENVRNFALVLAGISKIIFISLVLIYGRQFMSYGAGTAVIADTLMIALYATFLITSRNVYSES
jgi:hypothetical protein